MAPMRRLADTIIGMVAALAHTPMTFHVKRDANGPTTFMIAMPLNAEPPGELHKTLKSPGQSCVADIQSFSVTPK